MDGKELVIANDYKVGIEEDGSGVRVTLEVDGLPNVRIPGRMLEDIVNTSATLIELRTFLTRVANAIGISDEHEHDCDTCPSYDLCDLPIRKERGVTIEVICPDDDE